MNEHTLLEMMTGKLLGDGCITKQNGRKPRFQFIHSSKDKEWCHFCYSQLNKYIPLTTPRYKKVLDDRVNKGYTECYQVQSKTDPIITQLEKAWYLDRRKILPFELLEIYLTPLALAWWYQDDGHLKRKGETPEKIILSSESFAPQENKNLQWLLKIKFLLQFSIDKQNRLVLYDQFQIHYFLNLISPFLHYSMNRKALKSCPTENRQIKSRRTSIYLPGEVQINKPTEDINNALNSLEEYWTLYKSGQFYTPENIVLIQRLSVRTHTKSYQININQKNLRILKLLRESTGINYSILTTLCFFK